MSVIIRLQNLPWNANALDIRRFFQGLAIPDGGVHIIGGDKGDAFIAFSTDEDARQAMMKDNGLINGYAIKLLLSSKTEMQNVISAAKGGPPPLPAAPAVGVPKPVGFYERLVIPPVGGAPVPFVGGGVGDVTGSGQGLRSSTGIGSLPVPYGYPGNNSQMIAAQPPGTLVRMSEPPRAVPVPSVMPPPGRSVFDVRPPDIQPLPGNPHQPPPIPVDPLAHRLPAVVPGLPPVGSWNSSQPPMNRDQPMPDFGRPADIQGNQGVGYNTFNPAGGREPVRLDGRNLDANYPYSAPGSGMPAVDMGRNLGGPPPNVGRDFGRGDTGVPLGRPEEQRDPGRFVGDRPGWAERDVGRLENRPDERRWSNDRRSFGGRDNDNDARRDFSRFDADRGIPAPDRWMEVKENLEGWRSKGPDRGYRDMMPNEGPVPPRPGAMDRNDRFDAVRPPAFSEGSSSRFGPNNGTPGMGGFPERFGPNNGAPGMGGFPERFGPDNGAPGMGGFPDSRPKMDSGPGFRHPEPGFREPPHTLMDEPLRRPPLPEQHWMEDRRGHGPPPPRFDDRPPSPPRDRHFPGGPFPPRDEPWHDDRRAVDPRQMSDPGPTHDLCMCAMNFPQLWNYRQVRRFFVDCEIPRDGVKLINDRMGLRTGIVFVRVADGRSLNVALGMHGRMVENCRINIERCTDADFDVAVDGAPPKRGSERSRSPRSRNAADENSNISYFVLKKLPAKTEKEDIRKFFGKFRIAPDGGPYFELAIDKSATGNALVAIEEKDSAKVLALHRNATLHGTRIDVIKVTSFEFEERSRRSRQCERDGDKDAGQGKSSAASSSAAARDKKAEKQDTKPKELDRSGNSATEDDSRRTGGSDSDQRSHCVELRGLPYTATLAMLQNFFRDIKIPSDSIHIVYNRERRATGIAYIEFKNAADQKRALEKDKQHMAHRFIEVRALSKAEMSEEYNKQQQKFGGAPVTGSGSGRANADRPKPGAQALLSMQNLHFDTQLEDILEFFAGYHPIIDSIKLQYKDGQPTGDGLVAFQSPQEAESAIRNKNHSMLLGKPVTLSWPKK